MHWRRLIAASLELTAEMLWLIAEEVFPAPPEPPKPQPKKPVQWTDGENH